VPSGRKLNGLGVGFGLGPGLGLAVGFGLGPGLGLAVGFGLGPGLGLAVGFGLGPGLGLAVGFGLGPGLGLAVGFGLGPGLGLAVGFGLGPGLGLAVGFGLGPGLGLAVGFGLGPGLGLAVGFGLGPGLGLAVGFGLGPGLGLAVGFGFGPGLGLAVGFGFGFPMGLMNVVFVRSISSSTFLPEHSKHPWIHLAVSCPVRAFWASQLFVSPMQHDLVQPLPILTASSFLEPLSHSTNLFLVSSTSPFLGPVQMFVFWRYFLQNFLAHFNFQDRILDFHHPFGLLQRTRFLYLSN
jgi:hypothetical protein